MILNWILSEAWPYIAAAVAGGVGLLYAFMRGRASAEQDIQKDERKAIDKAKEVQNEISSMGDDDVNRRLTSWLRGGKR